MKILSKLGYEKYFALLYLFFPGIVFFSRTIMSEIPSILFILLGVYLYIKSNNNNNNKIISKHNNINKCENNKNCTNNYLYSGIMFGIATIIRNPNALIFAGFAGVLFFKNRRKFYQMVAGFIPFIILILLYNYVLFGNILSSSYGSEQTIGRIAGFSILSLVVLFKYILFMIIIYPLMLFAPLLYRGKIKNEIKTVTFLYVLIFGILLHWDTFHYGFIKNMIIGPRYFFTIVPLLIITIIPFYKKMFRLFGITKKGFKIFMFFCIILLMISSIYMTKIQYNYTNDLNEIKLQIYENAPEDSLIYGSYYVSMFVDNAFGKRGFIATKYDYEKNELKLPFIEKYLNDLDVNGIYVVFINRELQGIGENEVFIENQGENYLTEMYEAEVVYFTEEPQYLKIYKIVNN